MSTFVLVHGTWGGGWQWRSVAEHLRSNGHCVFSPTLTGLGERQHLISRQTDLDTHIQDVAAVIACEQLHDVVLVGTSYAGLVISGVAELIVQQIAALIYLNAALPTNGKCMLDTVSAERRAEVCRIANEEGDGFRVPTSLVLDTGIEDEGDREKYLRRMTPHPLASLLQPVRLTGKFKEVARKAYILATRKVSHRFREYHAWAGQQDDWIAREIASHHYPMATMPDETAALLMDIAK